MLPERNLEDGREIPEESLHPTIIAGTTFVPAPAS
jgi:hypothetical protein